MLTIHNLAKREENSVLLRTAITEPITLPAQNSATNEAANMLTLELPCCLRSTSVCSAHFEKTEKKRSRAWSVRSCEILQRNITPIVVAYDSA